MTLATLAWLSLWGLAYVYAAKMADTLYHGLFAPAWVAVVVVGLNILAGVAQVLFFLDLGRRWSPLGKPGLKAAAWLAVAGSTAALAPKLLGLLLVLQPEALLPLLLHGPWLAALGSLLAPLMLLAFALAWLIGAGRQMSRGLRAAFAAGAAGWLVMALAHGLVAANYLASGRLVWLAGLFQAGPALFVTASSLTLAGLGLFFLAFARGGARELGAS